MEFVDKNLLIYVESFRTIYGTAANSVWPRGLWWRVSFESVTEHAAVFNGLIDFSVANFQRPFVEVSSKQTSLVFIKITEMPLSRNHHLDFCCFFSEESASYILWTSFKILILSIYKWINFK